LGESRLFTVGIGAAPNAWFMRRAAEIGRGSFTQVGRADEVAERVGALWRRIRTPALRDLCVDWGVPAETYPEIIPDLYAGQPLWVTAKLDRAPGQVSLCGELDGRDWQMAVSPLASMGSETLAALWARRKLDSLEEQLMFGVDPAVVREESVAVALAFGLLTRYTNLVAVDRTPRRHDAALTSGRVPGLLPAGAPGSTAFATTATGWLPRLLAALAVFSVAAVLLLYGGARLPTQRSASPGGHTLPQPEPPPA
ncbi:MAG: hypothetical protein R3233_09520, partial [Xanthomonadales bacterium]|nr:hypothetical protein [Xanthomonadales bacterium]